jgi:hypothetical protein
MADGSRSSSGSEEKTSISSWIRYGTPSVADLLFVVLLLTLLMTPLSVKLLGDAGIGWHIRTGQQILAIHRVPRVDPFSSTMEGKQWFAWEWFYDLVVGALDAACGLNGPVWLTAIVIGAVFAFLFQLLTQRGMDLMVALLFWLLAVSASTIHFLARPHVLSWLFSILSFWILGSTERDCLATRTGQARFRLWLLPLLMLLWVNVHGGFVLEFVLLGIFWLGALWIWWNTSESLLEESLRKIAAGKRIRDLTVVGTVTAAASLLNPCGWKLHEHIYRYLTNRFLMDHIEEFQSPNFHGLAERCFLLLVLLSIALLIVRGRQLSASDALTVLFAVYAGLYASRNIPISSIFLAMSAGPLCPKAGFRGFFGRIGEVDSQLRGHLWPVLSVAGTLVIVLHGGRIGSNQLVDAHFDQNRMPVEAVSFLRGERINAPILGPDYWGGYLIYGLYPQEKVVVDDRHDFYGSEFLKSYLKMIHVENGWESFLQQTHPGCLLLPRESALADRISKTTGWRSVYADKVSIVFAQDFPGH